MSDNYRAYKRYDFSSSTNRALDLDTAFSKSTNYELVGRIFILKSIKGRELENMNVAKPIISFHSKTNLLQGMDNLYCFEAKFYKNDEELWFGPINISKREFATDSNLLFSELFRKALSLTAKYKFLKTADSEPAILQFLSSNNSIIVEFLPDFDFI